MPSSRTEPWQDYPADDEGVPVGAALVACDNGHVCLTSAPSLKRDAACWARSCGQPLHKVSRRAADRMHERARLATQLGAVS